VVIVIGHTLSDTEDVLGKSSMWEMWRR
jgi:hypothetical protein